MCRRQRRRSGLGHLVQFVQITTRIGWSNFRAQAECEIARGRTDLSVEIGRIGALSHVNVACRFASEIEGPELLFGSFSARSIL